MDRRAYLAAAAVTALAGCTIDGTNTPGSSGSSDTPTAPSSSSNAGVTPASGVVEPGSEDDFADLSWWEATGGSIDTDEERSLLGSQSARFETHPGSELGVLSKTFAEPVDVTGVVPGVALAADAVVVPWLSLVDEGGNRLDYRRGVTGDLPLMRYNFGVDSVDDAFDPTSVTDVEFRFWTDESSSRTLWFDDFHFVPRPDTGKVMIQFDDTYKTDYTEALPRLEAYGYPAVTFVNPEYVGREVAGRDRVTEDELDDLHDAGWTLSNHTYSHPYLHELSADEQEREISDGKAWLEDRGYEEGARYFAYPFGSYNATTVELVDEYHEIGYGGGYPVQGYTTNHVLASRIDEPDREQAEREFEWTASFPGITCLFYHELVDDLLTDFEETIEVLHEYESAGEIEVILPRDVESDLLY